MNKKIISYFWSTNKIVVNHTFEIINNQIKKMVLLTICIFYYFKADITDIYIIIVMTNFINNKQNFEKSGLKAKPAACQKSR